MKQNKKGFTIVELVIVIAVIAILAAVLIPTFSNIIKKANTSSDTQLVRNLNTALAEDTAFGNEHNTMQDALDAAEEAGYIVSKINAKASGNKILWDSVADCFCYLDGETGKVSYTPDVTAKKADNNVDLWTIASEPNETYSTYLYKATATTFDNVKTGLDVGNETITSITYTGTTGYAVTIRTNSVNTVLTIDAANSTVNHYDIVNNVFVKRTAYASYHEYGTVAYVECASGKVVAETGAEINTVVLTAVKADGDLAAVVYTNGGTIENTYATTNAVASANNDANTTHDTLDIKVLSEGGDVLAETEAEAVTLINNEEDGIMVTAVEATQTELQLVCTHNFVDHKCSICGLSNFYWTDVANENKGGFTKVDDTYYEISSANGLALFAKKNNTDPSQFKNCTIKLTADVDLSGYYWMPIGIEDFAFVGTFDGNNKVISNLNAVIANEGNTGRKSGLFGALGAGAFVKNVVVDGANIEGINHVGVITGYAICATIQDCTVKNATIKVVVDNHDDGDKAGAICGYFTCEGNGALSGCTVENVTVTGYRDIGGLVGYAGCYTSSTKEEAYIKNNTLTNVTVINDKTMEDYKNYSTDAEYDVNIVVGDTSSQPYPGGTDSVCDHIDISNNTTTNCKIEIKTK